MDPVLLDNLIARLEADLDLTAERLRLARELRATFDTGADSAPAPVSPPAAPAAAEPDKWQHAPVSTKQKAARKHAAQRVACPDCGQVFSASGLGPHRAKKHPGSAAKPIAPVPAPKPATEPPAAAEASPTILFECSDCGARTPNKQALAAHTDRAHRRGLHAEEHLAIDPSKAAA